MGRNKKSNGWDEIDGGMAFVIPYTLLRHTNFRRLSAHAQKLLLDLGCQYTGFNNGYLCASWTLMKRAGWRSTHTLRNAMLELEHYCIIVCTQQGGRNRESLHAITWRRIDRKESKPIPTPPTLKPDHRWKAEGIPDFVVPQPAFRRPRKPRTLLKAAA